jgi:hypothetical protein
MKKILSIFLVALFTIIPSSAEAATYKLTVYFDLELYNAFAGMTADSFVEDLDNKEQTCTSLLMVAALRQYDTENLNPLIMGDNYKVKNESGRVIASGKFKSKTSRPGGPGSSTCRAEVTLSLPRAKFYDVVDSDGETLISGFPFSKFKKNAAKVNIWDWN